MESQLTTLGILGMGLKQWTGLFFLRTLMSRRFLISSHGHDQLRFDTEIIEKVTLPIVIYQNSSSFTIVFFWLCIWYFNYPNILIWFSFTYFLHGISMALAGGPLRGGGAAAALCAESGGGTLLLAADWRAYGDGTCYGTCWVFQGCPIGSRISHDKDLQSQNFFVDLWLCHSERIDMRWGYCLNGIVDQQVGKRIVETMGFSLHGPSEQCTNPQTTSTLCLLHLLFASKPISGLILLF